MIDYLVVLPNLQLSTQMKIVTINTKLASDSAHLCGLPINQAISLFNQPADP